MDAAGYCSHCGAFYSSSLRKSGDRCNHLLTDSIRCPGWIIPKNLRTIILRSCLEYAKTQGCKFCKTKLSSKDAGKFSLSSDSFSGICAHCYNFRKEVSADSFQKLIGARTFYDIRVVREASKEQIIPIVVSFKCEACRTWFDCVDNDWLDISRAGYYFCKWCYKFGAARSQGRVQANGDGGGTMLLRGKVQIHKKNGQLAISTNAESERDFTDGTAQALRSVDGKLTDQEFSRLLELSTDICCKMRGYKADVQEKRVIVAGSWIPDDGEHVIGKSSDESKPEVVNDKVLVTKKA